MYKYPVAATRSSADLMQATLHLIAESGVDALTLSRVAARAGVSRATAYREFGDKNGLLSAVAEHEIRRMVEVMLADIEPRAQPVTLVEYIVTTALHYLRSHPAFNYVRENEPHWLLHAFTVGQSRLNLVQTVAAVVAPAISVRDGLVLPPVQAAEIVVRTVLSHVLIEGSALTDRQVAEAVTRAIFQA